MGTQTKIEWTDHTWNPWRGCAKVSAGCANCYAEHQANRRPDLLGEWGPGGTRVMAAESYWRLPSKWNRDAEAAVEMRRVFCGSMMDFFEDRPELRLPRARAWRIMIYTPHLDWLLLTKRPDEAKRWFDDWADLTGESDEPQLVRGPEETRRVHPSGRGRIFATVLESMGTPPPGYAYPTFDWMEGPRWWPPIVPNIWLGVSVENQATADERIPRLLAIPAALRFLSIEPLLGPVNLRLAMPCDKICNEYGNAECPGTDGPCVMQRLVDWVIVGGESGPNARPCNVAWVRSIVQQCQKADVPIFVKQLGAVPYVCLGSHDAPAAAGWRVDCRGEAGFGCRKFSLHDPKGGDPAEWPEDLRVREFPN